MKYTKQILNNGLTVLKVPIPSSESVLVNFFVKTGSRYETAEQRGLSHFLEHLLFKGTKKYPNAKMLSSIVEEMGADYNAATGKEYTLYYIKAASKHLAKIFDILSDMLQAPKLDPKEIEREKGVIIEEMNMYRDLPMRYIGDILEEQMWPNSDLGEQIIGTEKTVLGLYRDRIKRYISESYSNKNLILAIAGKYEDKQVDQLVHRYWYTKAAGERNQYSLAPNIKRSPLPAFIHYKNTQQAHLAIGFYAFPYDHPANYTLQVLSNLLGGGMSSRLFSEIRERRGLAYYVRSGVSHYQDTGSLVITSGLKLKKLPEAISVIAKELKKLKSTPVKHAELKKAKENLKGHLTLSLEDSEHRLEWYLDQIAFQKKTITPAQAFKKVDAVTPNTIKSLAQKLFSKDNYRLAVIGPYKKQERKLVNLFRV